LEDLLEAKYGPLPPSLKGKLEYLHSHLRQAIRGTSQSLPGSACVEGSNP
jgi:hypothetical protein